MIRGKSREEFLLAKAIVKSDNVTNPENIFIEKPFCVSLFGSLSKKCAVLKSEGRLVLDFGKEISGGLRIITVSAPKNARLRIVFGESLSEAMSSIGEKSACNDHSPRDITVSVSALSDLTFGQTAFRFASVENLSDGDIQLQSIAAVSRLTDFGYQGYIKTDDEEINKILETAAYTMHMCCQNGYIWDGVKRDRLVWSGDLHQEILTSFYLFGDIENIPASLEFLCTETENGSWINGMPAYSAWWVINLCTYCGLSGNHGFFERYSGFAEEILAQFNSCISEDGKMNIDGFFLDWPTADTPDAEVGTAVIIITAAKKYLAMKSNADATELCKKLYGYLDAHTESKQARAFKLIADGSKENAVSELGKNGAHGFSTFMAYYILSAYHMAGGTNALALIKEYFGGMLSKGATTFWEDFDLDWLKGTSEIDELPKAGERDIHGDFGNYCYKGFRHSLCHGWSSGIYAFFVESILGVKIENGRLKAVEPRLSGLKSVKAELPLADGILKLDINGDDIVFSVEKPTYSL